MYYDGFHRSFCDTDDLDTIHESDCIFAFETPEIFRPEGILSQRGKLITLFSARSGSLGEGGWFGKRMYLKMKVPQVVDVLVH